ncbi:MAG: 23S rRNA (guanosine(2251)-2'-O)-methyltransferase RlmB [Bacteroidota bacterium]
MQKSNTIYGIRTVIEALNSNKTIDKVFLQKGLRGSLHHELMAALKQKDVPVAYVPFQKLDRLTQNNHQGVVALISPIRFFELEELVESVITTHNLPLFLLLDGISDVRNFGAIIRTAECSGTHGIIIPKKGAAQVNADTVKTSAGAAFKVPIAKTDHIKDAIFYLQASGIPVIAATEKTPQSIYDINFNRPCGIVMGAEDSGISPSVLKSVDHKAKLPLLGEIQSLNVSVACGVFLYEVVRQRGVV